MRVTASVLALLLSCAAPAAAQVEEWDLYTSVRDGFQINFPGPASRRSPSPPGPHN
jgi:hypothetical protein